VDFIARLRGPLPAKVRGSPRKIDNASIKSLRGLPMTTHRIGSSRNALAEKIEPSTVRVMHLYEVHPRKDHRGVDLISDPLPFGRFNNRS
jgi:hypothetical protein